MNAAQHVAAAEGFAAEALVHLREQHVPETVIACAALAQAHAAIAAVTPAAAEEEPLVVQVDGDEVRVLNPEVLGGRGVIVDLPGTVGKRLTL